MSYDPDAAPFADLAAQVAAANGVFEFTIGSVAFANPWHDEIGRFAPKGYVRSGTHIRREIEIPRSNADGDTLNKLMELYAEVRDAPQATGLHTGLVRELARLAKDADQQMVEELIKPASRAIADGEMDYAGQLIVEAREQVMQPFTEEFDVPEPEQVEVTQSPIDPDVYSTVTPEGRRVWFDKNSRDVSDDQIQMILSSATTALRAGNLHGVDRTAAEDQYDLADVKIRVQSSYDDLGIPVQDSRTMGYVDISTNSVDPTRHHTVNLTPELIAGKFDPGGADPPDPNSRTASANTVEPLRWTTLHEVGHVSIFEETIVDGRGTDWFNEQMQTGIEGLGIRDVPFTSAYGRSNALEMHAEQFAEWVNTGGTTNNPITLKYAEQFGWSNPNAEDLPLAATGAAR